MHFHNSSTLYNLIINYHSSISQYTIHITLISILQLNITHQTLPSHISIYYYTSLSLANSILLLIRTFQVTNNNTNHQYSHSVPSYIISHRHITQTILKTNYTNKRNISLSYFNYHIRYHIIITCTSSILNTSFSFFISGHPTQLS